MFGVDSIELFIVAIAALVFIGPKELPGTLRTLGRWIGKVRGYARHFNAGVEAMMREAELEEMEKEWAEQNARIMAQYPGADDMPPIKRQPSDEAQSDLPLGDDEADLPPEERGCP
ncbi:Sec-independent protein translocase subunit TatA/TatB [Sphingomicrobium nitratireducens]|uniref:Sec-independent protein translocase subunit TatA/TatB n=1 Tax=Sphingomicrobium nitratireducens TaxID=2964666 RepID=UPI00223FE7AC|nr:twin-arginine translocase subunit TatB [Sphingomicrobium nitratireducens]